MEVQLQGFLAVPQVSKRAKHITRHGFIKDSPCKKRTCSATPYFPIIVCSSEVDCAQSRILGVISKNRRDEKLVRSNGQGKREDRQTGYKMTHWVTILLTLHFGFAGFNEKDEKDYLPHCRKL